jgi:hypothetical protein
MQSSNVIREYALDLPIEQRVVLALEFLLENPTERTITAARIYHVNDSTLRTLLQRAKKSDSLPVKPHGGQNRILSEAQVKAIYDYVEESYLSGYTASKSMVYAAIVHLRLSANPPQSEPSIRWFQGFLKENSKLLHTIKPKPIARVQVSAQDVTIVENWFKEYTCFITEHEIQPENIYNFDETGFRVGMAPGEDVIVPTYVKEVSYLLISSNSIYL